MGSSSSEGESSSLEGSDVAIAAGWGLLSALSLIIGSVIGVVRLPSLRLRAVLMAFGGGALTEALSIELFGHILHKDEDEPGLVWAAIGAAIFGGLFFATLDWGLNNRGAFMRKAATVKSARTVKSGSTTTRRAAAGGAHPAGAARRRARVADRHDGGGGVRVRRSSPARRQVPLYFIAAGSVSLSLCSPLAEGGGGGGGGGEGGGGEGGGGGGGGSGGAAAGGGKEEGAARSSRTSWTRSCCTACSARWRC